MWFPLPRCLPWYLSAWGTNPGFSLGCSQRSMWSIWSYCWLCNEHPQPSVRRFFCQSPSLCIMDTGWQATVKSTVLSVVCSAWWATSVITKRNGLNFFHFTCGFNNFCLVLSFMHGQKGSMFFSSSLYNSSVFLKRKKWNYICCLAKTAPDVRMDMPNLAGSRW